MASPDTTVHPRTCPLCEATCGLEITVRDRRVLRIRGDRQDPVSRGFICPKGSTLKQLHEDPDRLTQPVVRRDGEWVPVSWDEAFLEIDTRLKPLVAAHGRSCQGVVIGNPNVHNLGGSLYLRHVIKAAATPNIFSASTVDQMPKHMSAGLMWGDPGLFPLPDIERTDYLLVLGANPYVSNGSLVTVPDLPGKLDALRRRGGKLVVVDPRRSRTAERADEHLFIRPGTDVVWLLSLIHVLFDEQLVDLGSIADRVSGVDEVGEAAAAYPPERAEPITGIDADTTRRIARELAASPTAAAYGRVGVHTTAFGTLASWATDVVNVLTGNFDRPGGIMFNCAPTLRLDREPGGRGFATGRWRGRSSGRPEVLGELPAAVLADEIDTPGDGQIRALFVIGCNPARSFPNSDRLDRALADLDLLVAVDPYINATTRHADVILPPPSALERSHYDVVFERNMTRVFAKYSPAVLPSAGPDEPEILCRLARVIAGDGASADPQELHRSVLEAAVQREVADESSPIHGRDPDEIIHDLAPWSWGEQLVDLRLRTGRFGDGFGATPGGLSLASLARDHPHGLDLGPLEPRFPGAARTPSGMVELFPEPIAVDLERLAHTDVGHDGLVLVGRRHLRSCNTWMHNVDVLVSGRERCTLQMHPGDIAALGLTEGDPAVVRSRVGEVTAPVESCESLMAGVVSLPFGWGYDTPGIEMQVARTRPGVNANVLTDDRPLDEPSGTAVLNAIPVEVLPVR